MQVRRVTPARDDRQPMPEAAAGRTLCVGLGCTRGAAPQDVAAAAAAILQEAGLATRDVRLVATARRRQHEPALRQWAAAIGAGFAVIDDSALDAQPVATVSERVRAAIGVASVAEAAALAASHEAALLVRRRTAALPGGHYLTLAVAR